MSKMVNQWQWERFKNQWQFSIFATDFDFPKEKSYTDKSLIYNDSPTTRGTVKVAKSAFGT